MESWFRDVDFTIIGSGIVGVSTAHFLRCKFPEAKIIILEKGLLPEGASTKNAGFACFGTLSEILFYLETHTEEEIYDLVERRFRGLKKLRSLLGDENIDYTDYGGFEIFRIQDNLLLEKCLDHLERINHLLFPIFDENVYGIEKKDFGFANILKILSIKDEGQIHTGKMMKTYVKLIQSEGVSILNNIEVKSVNDSGTEVEVILKNDFALKSKKVFLCTNAFTNRLVELDLKPARAQVLVTKPIENLKFKGSFHIDEGFYYFRNIGNRVLFGGGRNLDIEGETTTDFGITNRIQNQLETYLKEIILPDQNFEIDHRWSGIMGMGSHRSPIVKQLSENLYCGVRLSGTGVAIGTLVGEELAGLVS